MLRRTAAHTCFQGSFVIITGGSKGIGLAIAAKVFALGADLCIVARDTAGLETARAIIEKNRIHAGQLLATIACDTCDREQLAPLLQSMVKQRRTPDFLINCVGFARPEYVEKLELSDYRRQMELNYFGQLIPVITLMPFMIAAGRGHIVNVSSLLGFMGCMGYAAYCPGKFAIAGLTEALRCELSHRGLFFSVVFPPDVDTPGYAEENRSKPPECREMTKRGGLLSAEQVADAIISGIVRRRKEITMGEATFIRWMYRHMPWLVRAVMARDYRKAREQIKITC